ncbi:MAG: D-arabinono-1,4-lactone oxidase, partial [Bacteroidota bacterium]
GTGIKKPAVPDMVRSLGMVGTGGEFLQIEPTDGMTDPAKWDDSAGVRLIQDDDIFHSVILGFGAMGIIYEITLEVEKQYYMLEKRVLRPWTELRMELLTGEFIQKVEDTDFVAFRVNPYQVKGEHRCAVVEQEIVPKDIDLSGLAHPYRRNIFSSVMGNLIFLIENTIQKLLRKPERVKKTIQTALWATQDKAFFGKSHEVLYQSGDGVIRYGISSEFAFPADGEKIVEVLEAIFARAKRNGDEAGLYQSAHIPVRFVPASKALLSSCYGRPTVFIDVPLLFGTTGDIEILEGYQKMMIDMGGIPHWGKHNTQLYQHKGFIQEQFPRAKDWTRIRDELDPKGTFLNDFVVLMGLAELPN